MLLIWERRFNNILDYTSIYLSFSCYIVLITYWSKFFIFILRVTFNNLKYDLKKIKTRSRIKLPNLVLTQFTKLYSALVIWWIADITFSCTTIKIIFQYSIHILQKDYMNISSKCIKYRTYLNYYLRRLIAL